MPKFTFFNLPQNISFQCNLRCDQCTAIKPDGQRCRKRTCKSLPLCYIHLNTIHGLKIKESTLEGAGDGLFANKDFNIGEIIIGYVVGDLLDDEGLDNRYGDATAPYALKFSPTDSLDLIVDSACKRGIAAWINNADDTNATIEEIFVDDVPYRLPYIVASKFIESGDEIFVNYGSDYNISEPGVTFRTTPYN
jgi:hypothetical protein